ncbi:MAG: hypothetical protein IJ493_01830 [Clostridia bacterium]|nr:hypothetical protein [Clostridia bacterium]
MKRFLPILLFLLTLTACTSPKEENSATFRVEVIETMDDWMREYPDYDADEMSRLFGVDVTGLRQNPDGSGGFRLLAEGELGDARVFAANIGVAVEQDGQVSVIDAPCEMTEALLGDTLWLLGDGLYQLNLPAGTLEGLVLPDGHTPSLLIEFAGYEIAYQTSDGIWGWRDGGAALLCDYAASDLTGAYDVEVVSADELITVSRALTGSGYERLRLTRVPADTLASRTKLTLAALPDADAVRAQVIAFNRASADYRIEIVSFEPDVNERGIPDNAGAVTRFNAEIAGSFAPDILVMNPAELGLDLDSYAEKGLFADLYPLMDADGYDRENLMECQRESFSLDGGLYCVATLCTVEAVLGGDAYDHLLTLDETLDVIDSLDEDGVLYERFYSWSLTEELLLHSLGEFVDFESGETSFDSETFRRFAELYREIVQGERTFGGTPIFRRETLLDEMFDIARLRVRLNADSLTVVGYPGRGALLTPQVIIGVGGKSAHQAAAWEFVKLCLSDEFLLSSGGISRIRPVTRSAFDAAVADNLGKYYFVGENGMGIISDKPYGEPEISGWNDLIGAGRVVLLDDSVAEELAEIIASARAVRGIERRMLTVVQEELSAYAAGRGTLDDAVRIIDDRVSTVYNEQK